MKKVQARLFFEAPMKKLTQLISCLDLQLGLSSKYSHEIQIDQKIIDQPVLAMKGNTLDDKSRIIIDESNKADKANKISKENKEEKTKDDKQPKEQKPKKEEKPKKEKQGKNDDKNEDKLKTLFSEVELKVGKVVEIKELANSDGIFHCHVDVGEEKIREIGCGLRKYGVSKEEFTRDQIVVFANLKPKKLGGMYISLYRFDVQWDDIKLYTK